MRTYIPRFFLLKVQCMFRKKMLVILKALSFPTFKAHSRLLHLLPPTHQSPRFRAFMVYWVFPTIFFTLSDRTFSTAMERDSYSDLLKQKAITELLLWESGYKLHWLSDWKQGWGSSFFLLCHLPWLLPWGGSLERSQDGSWTQMDQQIPLFISPGEREELSTAIQNKSLLLVWGRHLPHGAK